MKLGNAFGGGIARAGETCGAVTGAIMVISLNCGSKDHDDSISKDKAYDMASKFMEQFTSRNQSTMCRKLLGFEIGTYTGHDKYEIIYQRCPGLVRSAAEIIEEMLGE